MAKKSMIIKNERRRKTAERYKERRAELKAVLRDPSATAEARYEAQRRLQAMPRDASPTRTRNRCSQTGRPRGYYRRFSLSRIALREAALNGELPGVHKASW